MRRWKARLTDLRQDHEGSGYYGEDNIDPKEPAQEDKVGGHAGAKVTFPIKRNMKLRADSNKIKPLSAQQQVKSLSLLLLKGHEQQRAMKRQNPSNSCHFWALILIKLLPVFKTAKIRDDLKETWKKSMLGNLEESAESAVARGFEEPGQYFTLVQNLNNF